MITPILEFRGKWRVLSNFFILSHPLNLHGYSCRSTEHWYQLYRVRTEQERTAVAQCYSAGQAKRLAHKLDKAANPAYPIHETFTPTRQQVVMEQAVRHKFRQGTPEHRALMSTGDAYLEEGNTWHDNFWGNCSCSNCTGIVGQNLLGKLLMKIRDEFIAGGV